MSVKTNVSLSRKLLEQEQLLDPDSESDDQHLADHIESILLELIPTYYKYRGHLVNILKEEGREDLLESEERQTVTNAEINRKCQEYKEILSKKGQDDPSRRRERIRVTEKIVEKHRKKQKEERELLLKYEAKEIQKLMGNIDPAYQSQYPGSAHFGFGNIYLPPSESAIRSSFNAQTNDINSQNQGTNSIGQQVIHQQQSFDRFQAGQTGAFPEHWKQDQNRQQYQRHQNKQSNTGSKPDWDFDKLPVGQNVQKPIRERARRRANTTQQPYALGDELERSSGRGVDTSYGNVDSTIRIDDFNGQQEEVGARAHSTNKMPQNSNNKLDWPQENLSQRELNQRNTGQRHQDPQRSNTWFGNGPNSRQKHKEARSTPFASNQRIISEEDPHIYEQEDGANQRNDHDSPYFMNPKNKEIGQQYLSINGNNNMGFNTFQHLKSSRCGPQNQEHLNNEPARIRLNAQQQNDQYLSVPLKFLGQPQNSGRQGPAEIVSYEDDFQDDDFYSEINAQGRMKRSNHNIVRMEYDETHSERNKRPLQRHNTPNFETFSHRGKRNPYFDLQREKIEKQRRQAELLHRQVSEVLGEVEGVQDIVSSKYMKKKKQESRPINQVNEDYEIVNKKSIDIRNSMFASGEIHQFEGDDRLIAGMRFVLEELCQLWSICEFFKYLLKNKQYSILQKLGGSQIGTGPISLKILHQGAEKVVKKEESYVVKRIISKIFGEQDSLNFEDFGNALKSKLNEAQVKYINVKVSPINPHEVVESLVRLFSVYAEIIYFEDKLKDLVLSNPKELQDFKAAICSCEDPSDIDFFKLESFIYKTDGNRANRLRIVLFLKNTLKAPKVSEFINWLKNSFVEHSKIFAFMFAR